MISYAQNREDVVLARAFADRRSGFYIDVGAEDPTAMSVTKHFYELGWRGINIEPTPTAFAALERERPEDVNLRVGLADRAGTATLFEGPPDNHGSSTFDPEVAAAMAADGVELHRVDDVTLTTLALVCEEWVGDREVDFLKIDVEGWERAVIEGADWDRWRPRVVVVEATVPNTTTPSHEAWEPVLLDVGYVCTLFDGLNRFYARVDLPELHGPLSIPANVHDRPVDFGPLRTERALRGEIERHAAALAEAQEHHRALLDRFAAVEEDQHALADQLATHVAALRDERRELELAREGLARVEEDLAARDTELRTLRRALSEAGERLEVAAGVERELLELQATKTFRWTSAARGLYGRLRNRSNRGT